MSCNKPEWIELNVWYFNSNFSNKENTFYKFYTISENKDGVYISNYVRSSDNLGTAWHFGEKYFTETFTKVPPVLQELYK